MHVSSSFRYDLMSAHDLGIGTKVWVNRDTSRQSLLRPYVEIKDISGLPARARALTDVRHAVHAPTGMTPRPPFRGAARRAGRRALRRGHRSVVASPGWPLPARLAWRARRSSFWRRARVGSGASGRNGGHLNNGLAHSLPVLAKA